MEVAGYWLQPVLLLRQAQPAPLSSEAHFESRQWLERAGQVKQAAHLLSCGSRQLPARLLGCGSETLEPRHDQVESSSKSTGPRVNQTQKTD